MFSYTEFQSGINICHITFLWYVWTNPNSSSLTNVENSTSKFCPSVQVCCGEKEREENNGNCKPFSVTRKCNNMFWFLLFSYFLLLFKMTLLVSSVGLSVHIFSKLFQKNIYWDDLFQSRSRDVTLCNCFFNKGCIY